MSLRAALRMSTASCFFPQLPFFLVPQRKLNHPLMQFQRVSSLEDVRLLAYKICTKFRYASYLRPSSPPPSVTPAPGSLAGDMMLVVEDQMQAYEIAPIQWVIYSSPDAGDEARRYTFIS